MRPEPQVTPLPYTPDSAAWFAAIAERRSPVWLDSAHPGSRYGRYDILAADPERVLTHDGRLGTVEEADGSRRHDQRPAFELIEACQPPPLASLAGLPFVSGAIGYFGYDLARQLETLPTQARRDLSLPDLWLGFYPWAIVQDHACHRAWLVARPECELAGLYRELTRQTPEQRLKSFLENTENNFQISQFEPEVTANSYLKSLDRIQSYIRAGDCYQVNLAQRFAARYHGHPARAFLALRETLPSPFSGYIPLPEGAVISLSPERFIEVREGRAETRPIKGTAARHSDPERDRAEGRNLLGSNKDRAENLMIVDLLRNDLSKSCRRVRVPSLFELQSFANVHHLVSTVTGELKPGHDALSLLRGSFPGGSITGAPKIRAMEIIEELEPVRRSVYCGSLGYLSADGAMDTSIAIRTLVCDRGRIYCWGGGGIVADSQPMAEYEETRNKVRALMEGLEARFS